MEMPRSGGVPLYSGPNQVDAAAFVDADGEIRSGGGDPVTVPDARKKKKIRWGENEPARPPVPIYTAEVKEQ